MAPLPTRKVLEEMKRADLQRLCKDYGVKANLKSEALIDLLLHTQSSPPSRQTRRSVSTRQSSRAGPSRISSIIVHDTDDEEESNAEDNAAEVQQQPPPVSPAPRTRKAKELQTRLGVGRPVAAGGSGPRAVTKSTSVSRGKRAKSSKSIKQMEATIEEEPEVEPIPEPAENPAPSNEISQAPEKPAESESSPHIASSFDIASHISEAVLPLEQQIKSLKSDLALIPGLQIEISQLKAQVSELSVLKQTVASLSAEMKDLHSQVASTSTLAAEIKELKDSIPYSITPPINPSTPKQKTPPLPKTPGPRDFTPTRLINNPAFPIVSRHVSSTSKATAGPSTLKNPLPHPGIAPGVLGKRHRDSTASNITGVMEEGEEGNLSESEIAKRIVRPTKKRVKLSEDTSEELEQHGVSSGSPVDLTHPSTADKELEDGQSSTTRVPTFSIYQDADEHAEPYSDQGPPMTHLPDFFVPPSPPDGGSRHGQGAASSSTPASESQFPFAFTYPAASTPANAMYLPSFPYPDPPQSPSPAGTNPGFMGHNNHERADIFKSFGFPSPTRAGRFPSLGRGASSGSGMQQQFVDPAALTQRSGSTGEKEREPSSNDVAAGLGLTILPTEMDDGSGDMSTDTLHTKRTMYGTELEGDTRFGDFGVKGVATGFWAGGKF